MIKDQQILRELVAAVEGDLSQARRDLRQRWGAQTGADERQAEGIDVASGRDAAEEGGLQGRGAPTHERVVNDVSRTAEALDKKARELRLETGAITDLLQAAGLALARRPEFVDVGGHFQTLAIEKSRRGGDPAAVPPELPE